MSNVTEKLRQYHHSFGEKLFILSRDVQKVDASTPAAVRESVEATVRFLEDELLPHADGEEKYLYPELAKLVVKYGRATGDMELDHIAIKSKVQELRSLLKAVFSGESRSPQDAARTADALRKTAIQLEAILSLHLDKENKYLLSLADKYLSAEQVDGIVSKMIGK